MTTTIIIAVCVLLLIAYVFDLTSGKTKIPSVILLLALGWLVKQGSELSGIHVPDLSALLPIFGTIGLILIVLEGALELELDQSKRPLIGKAVLVSLLPMLMLAGALAAAFTYACHCSWRLALLNAVPLCVISSAIAIPSVRGLPGSQKEFIIYESSLSDIFGVLFFNFMAVNEYINAASFGHFAMELVVIAIISFTVTTGLALLLKKIDHHIKFGPIIVLVILIYAIAKVYHLPGLIVILFFGLFLGNLDKLSNFKWVARLQLNAFDQEVHKFREITVEAAFLIRALFFLLFGFHIQTAELLDLHTLIWAIGIVAGILAIRFIALKATRLPAQPLVFIAPRGLITILLFLSIAPEQSIPLVNRPLVIQIIVLSAIVMAAGLMTNRKPADTPMPLPVPDTMVPTEE